MHILLMYQPSQAHFEALKAGAPSATFDVALTEEMAKEKIQSADAVLGNRFFIQSLPYARKLKWMQSNSVGVDLILRSELIEKRLQITSAKGIYDDEVAEHALALVLSLSRGIHLARDSQKEKKWNRTTLRQILGARCLILGFGGIGQGIAKRLKLLGAQVGTVCLRKESSEADWKEQLSATDFLIMALPLTKLTRGFVGKDELALLPPQAYLINVGRGETLDEEALLMALKEKRLSGAALDVFSEEPLSEQNPLWTENRIIITPHVARSVEIAAHKWEDLFVENVRRFYLNEPLLNLVDHDAGY